MTHNAETHRSFVNDPELIQMLESPEKDIKTFIPPVFRNLKQLNVHTEKHLKKKTHSNVER